MNGIPESQKSESARNVNLPIGTEEKKEIPKGFCQCGCGNLAPIIKQFCPSRNLVKGESFRFIAGHHRKNKFGEMAPMWNGGLSYKGDRVMVLNKEHPRAGKRGYVYRSHIVVEKAIGKQVPIKAEVHHFDNNKGNDNTNNLVICEDRSYHMLLHQRERAFRACGNANWRKCIRCKKYDNPENMGKRKCDGMFYHHKCETEYNRKRYKARKNGTN